MNINQFLNLGVNGLLKGLCKMGHALSSKLKWIWEWWSKNVIESNKQSSCTKGCFWIHWRWWPWSIRPMFIMGLIKNKGKLKYSCVYVTWLMGEA